MVTTFASANRCIMQIVYKAAWEAAKQGVFIDQSCGGYEVYRQLLVLDPFIHMNLLL